jgi:hypothetical protein
VARDRVGIDHLLAPERIRRLTAVVTGLAGAIHYLAVPEHRTEWWVAAVLFTVLGAAQLGWALLVWREAGRGLLLAGAAVNLAALAAWFTSRVWGLPFGPHAGTPEVIGVADLTCALAEAVAIAAVVLVVLARPVGRDRTANGVATATLDPKVLSFLSEK